MHARHAQSPPPARPPRVRAWRIGLAVAALLAASGASAAPASAHAVFATARASTSWPWIQSHGGSLRCRAIHIGARIYYVCRRMPAPPPGDPPQRPPEGPPPQPPVDPPPQPPQPPQPPVAGLTADEQRMVDLVNGERRNAGLPPLQVNLQIVKVARLKSQDMIDENYFGHNSPTYGSPFEMLKRFGVSYRYAGENIAGNPSVEGAHRALMSSPGHRANILKPEYTHFGIGIARGGPYGMMFAQLFVGQ